MRLYVDTRGPDIKIYVSGATRAMRDRLAFRQIVVAKTDVREALEQLFVIPTKAGDPASDERN